MTKNIQKELVVDKIIQISKLLDEICEIENEDGELTVNCFSKETMGKNPFPLSFDEFSMDLIEYARSILNEDENAVYLVIKTILKNGKIDTDTRVFENYEKAKKHYNESKKYFSEITNNTKDYIKENKKRNEFERYYQTSNYLLKMKIERRDIE